MSTVAALLVAAATACPAAVPHPTLQTYVDAIRERGADPVDFTIAALDSVDLILFDDCMHPAVEPFEFYQRLVRDPRFAARARSVFLETVPMNLQPALDAYLASEPEDRTLLYPAFQDDYSGAGWALRTYFDLLHTIWNVNRGLPRGKQLEVIGVASPCSWACIRTARDLALFRESLDAYDFQMYTNIRRHLDGFGSGRKGIFLTNTRHAYAGVRRRGGELYWNCGTFFRQWHPGKTMSVRCHGPQLAILAERTPDAATPRTTQGLERIEYKRVRVQNGTWDRAFAANGNRPVALSIAGTPFGSTPYVGNHMLDTAPGTTLADAYDAVVFLAPVDRWRRTATTAELYTAEFRAELERRYRILYDERQLADRMRAAGVTTLSALIEKETAPEPEAVMPQAAGLEPIDPPSR
jgi:hypothetical protein